MLTAGCSCEEWRRPNNSPTCHSTKLVVPTIHIYPTILNIPPYHTQPAMMPYRTQPSSLTYQTIPNLPISHSPKQTHLTNSKLFLLPTITSL